MTGRPPAAELRGVSFAHVPGHPVLTDVDLVLHRGEKLAMIGPNGGGKTTLLRLLVGLLEPDRGEVEVFGRPPAEMRRRIGYVPQRWVVDTAVPASALDVVLMGCLRWSPWGLRFRRRDRERAQETLDRVGLASMADRRLCELSGGQCQRVLIARALVGEPEFLLLDEPTSGVDGENVAAIMTALEDLGDVTLVLVSHDLRLVTAHFDRVVRVHRRVRRWPDRSGGGELGAGRWSPSLSLSEAPP